MKSRRVFIDSLYITILLPFKSGILSVVERFIYTAVRRLNGGRAYVECVRACRILIGPPSSN